MEIFEIIKDAFEFPSKDIGKLAIYIVLVIILSALSVGGSFTFILGLMDSISYLVIGVILLILSLIIGFIISGYQISIIKTGIDFEETAPEYNMKENLIDGIKYFIVSIVYFIIPAIIVSIVALITNVPGNLYAVLQESFNSSVNATVTANATVPAVSVISDVLMSNLIYSLAITGIVAIILFLIFSFIQTMAQSRLANTGSLNESLNIVESVKDIGRIGLGKVIAVIILLFIIALVINGIISLIAAYVPSISIIYIIVTPYLLFFESRAIGLLYSDIA